MPAATGLLANATDVEGDPISISGYTIAGVTGTQPVGTPVTIPSVGDLTINADGSYDFTPAADFSGPVPVITYSVTDGFSTDTSTLTLAVTNVNDDPTASAAPLTPTEDTPATGAITATDVDGDPLTYTLSTPPANGTVALNPDGTFTYTPDPGFNGSDPFTVTVDDGNGGTIDVTVPVSVGAVNDDPVASAAPLTPTEDTPATGAITATDPDGDPLTYTLSTPPANGTVTLNPDGTFSYTPDADYNGSDDFVVTVDDGNGGTVDVTVPVTVAAVNDDPTASAAPLTPLEDTPATGAVVATDVEGDPLTYTLSTPPANGTVALNPDGTFTYTPDPGFNGSDPFTVTVDDGNGGTIDVTVPVSVGAVNDDPVASAAPLTPTEDTPATGAITATDPDGDPLTYTLSTPPANGTVTLNPDGTFSYTPDADYNGSDDFVVTVDDGNGGTVDVTVPVTVAAVNDDPTASAAPLTPLEDTPATGAVVATDVEGDPLTYTLSTPPANGTVALNPDGTFTYTPDPGFNGSDPFTVTVDDGNGGTIDITVPVSVGAVNDDPVASAAPLTPSEDAPATGAISASDPDGDPLTYTLSTPPANGTVALNPDGTFSYTPDPDYNGSDDFVVTVDDGNGGTVDVTVPVTVAAVNDDPTASAAPLTPTEDTPATGAVVATDVDGDPLTYTLSTPPANGTVTLNPDGTFSYTPDPDFNGSDPFTVTVDDGNGGTIDVTVPVTVGATNDDPVASAAPLTPSEDAPATGAITASDPDGDPLTYTLSTPPANGTVTLNPDGTFSYTPDPDYNGSDDFVVTVDDGNGGTIDVTVPVTVAAVNDTPEAGVDTSNAVTEDTPLTVDAASGLLSGASDIDGDPLTVSGFTVAGEPGPFVIGSPYTIAGVGDVTLNPDGSYEFAPALDYTGPVPPITYTVDDGAGGTDTATLALAVSGTNDTPVASAAPLTPSEDTPATGAITATDADGDPLTFTLSTPPANGTVTLNPDGTFSYTPDADYNGSDDFVVTVDDGNGGTVDVTVPVTVAAVNDDPVASAAPLAPAEDTPATGAVIATDVDGDPLTFTLSTPPANGTVALNPDGTFTYTPDPDFNGSDPFTVTVDDGNGGTIDVTVPVSVATVNDNPEAGADTSNTATEDTPLNVDAASGLLSGASDVDGDPLTISDFTVAGEPGPFVVGTPYTIAGVGEVTLNPDGSYAFVPVADYDGPVPPITYTVSDGVGGTDTATLALAITGTNDVPEAGAPVTNALREGTTLSVPAAAGLLSGASDVDGNPLAITGYEIDGIAGPQAPGTWVTMPGVGDILINADGSYIFTPFSGYFGPVPAITYTVEDDSGAADTSTLTLALTPTPRVVGADADGDGVGDDDDIDDDNDGILDVNEGHVLVSNAITGESGGDFGTVTAYRDLETPPGGTYSYAPGTNAGYPEGTYAIVSRNLVADWHDLAIDIAGNTTGADDDAFLIVNGSTVQGTFYTQSVTVPTNADVLYGLDARSWASLGAVADGPPNLAMQIWDAAETTLLAQATTGAITTNAEWITTSSVFNTGANTEVVIRVVNLSTQSSGNDFAIDNLTFQIDIPANYTNVDSDGDGVFDHLDLDSDDDGITDNVEAQTTAGYIAPSGTGPAMNDVDGDGLDDVYDASLTGAEGSLGLTPVDTDSDGTADYLDTDSDNDGLDDVVERGDGQPTSAMSMTDTDGDGLLDIFEGAAVDDGFDVNDDNRTASTLNLAGVPSLAADGSNAVPLETNLDFRNVNRPPVDLDDVNDVTEDTPIVIDAASGLLAGASDPDGDPLALSDFTIAGEAGPFTLGAPYTIAGVGDVTVNADGSYMFAPAPDYIGPVPVITYTLIDGNGGSDTSTLTLTMVPVNDPPVDPDDVNDVIEDTPLLVDAAAGLLAGAADVDGDSSAITGYEIAGYIGTQPIDVPVAIPDVGEITINGDGSYIFTPAANYVGPIPVVTYTLADGNGGTDTSTLTLAMQGVNDVPVAGTLEDQGGWDSTSLEPYTVVAAFTDADGDALTFSLTGATPSWLTINPASGEILGTPPSDASQLSNMGQPGVYEVTVTATDPSGTTATAAYMLQIVNIPPVAYHDGEHDTPEGVGITLQVLDNDVDPDGDTIRVTGAESPDGKVTVNDDGSIYFEGTPGFVGWTTVTYDITDDQGGTSSASFDIHIDPAIVPDTPDAPEGPQQMVAIITPTEDVDGDILQTSQAITETWQREETGRIEGVARSSSNAGFTGFSIRFGDSGLGANQQGSGLEVETMSDRFMLSLGFKPIEGGST